MKKSVKILITITFVILLVIALFVFFLLRGIPLSNWQGCTLDFGGGPVGVKCIDEHVKSAMGESCSGDYQSNNTIGLLFQVDKKICLYPGSRLVKIKLPKYNNLGIAFTIRNLLSGSSAIKTFSYGVVVSDPSLIKNCNISESEVESWIVQGKGGDIEIAPGEFSEPGLILFSLPDDAPSCQIRFRVNVNSEGNAYAVEFFDLQILNID